MNMRKRPTCGIEKAKRIRDGILIAALLLCGAVGILSWQMLKADGALVEISVDGVTVVSYPLSEDRRVELITGREGEGKNILLIHDGKAEILDANCPDGICVDHHPVSREGETIVCLPNRMIVTVRKT